MTAPTHLRTVSTTVHPRRRPNMWRTLRPYAVRAGYTTQAQLAQQLCITREHLSRICRGAAWFTEPMEEHISHLLHLSHEERNAAFGYPGSKPSSMSSRSAMLGATGTGGVLARVASGCGSVGLGRSARSAER